MKALFYKGEDVTLTFSSVASLAAYTTKAVKFFTPFSTVKTAAVTTPDNNTIIAKLNASDTADLPAGTLNIVIELTASSGKFISKTIEAKLADAYIDGSEREETDLTTEVIFLQNQPIKVNFSLSGVQYDEIIAASNTAVTAKDTALAASSSAQSSATIAQSAATSSQTSANNSQSYANDAQTYATASQAARDASISAKTASETARDASILAKTGSEAARDQAQLIANSMIEGKGYKGLTSTSNIAIATGSKTFTTNLDVSATAFGVGTRIRIAYATNTVNFMEGVITSFSANSLTVNVDLIAGSGTWGTWNFSVAGEKSNISGTTNYLPKFTAANVLGNSLIYDNGTYIGINTTSPNSLLSIQAPNNLNDNLITLFNYATAANAYVAIGSQYYSGNTNVNSQIRFGNETASGASSFLALATGSSSSTERVRITSAGYVGIGIQNPTAGLAIIKSGTLWYSGSNYAQPAGNIFISMGTIASNVDNWFGITGDYNTTSGSANLLLQANFRDVGNQAGFYLSNQATGFGISDFTIGKLITTTSVNTPPTKTEFFRITKDGRFGILTSAPTTILDINSDILRLRNAKTPATATATGNQGDICWDSNFLYACVASNTWKRAALTTW